MNKKRYICIVDKEYPPNHSFVDGMLAHVLPSNGIKTTIITSKGEAYKTVNRYGKSINLATLFKRSGFWRFLNFFKLIGILNNLNKKQQYKSSTVFIRNEPIYLLVAVLKKKNYSKIIYQQSFPHEKTKNSFKRWITLLIFRFSNKHIDTVLGVSPSAVHRLKNIFTEVNHFEYIPLLTRKEEIISKENIPLTTKDEIPKLVYIGTHTQHRKLDQILKWFIDVLEDGYKFECTFIGGTQREIKNLYLLVPKLSIYANNIMFIEKLDRNELLENLPNFDVGLSLIPPIETYLESSPTKLVEYMSKGLFVLGNNEIPLQKQFIEESKGGLSINFEQKAIKESLKWISCNMDNIHIYKIRSREYALNYLIYESTYKRMM